MPYFNIVSETNESTVVTEYTPVMKNAKSYQSEAQLEAELIRMLQAQGYEYLQIHTEDELKRNLRIQLEKLNGYTFSDSEWSRFFSDCIANANDGIAEKAKRLQKDYVQVLRRDDGTGKNILLIDKKNIHNNFVQVINQYEVSRDDGAKHDNRYDVTSLVNGLPMVHIELKRRGVAIRETFNQIDRYQRDSFFAVDASSELRSKKELIETFIANANEMDDVFDDWRAFVKEQKEKEINVIITEENLKADETKKFVDNAFRDGELKATGVGIDNLLPPMRRFGGNSNRAEKKQTVIEKLKAFFERYFGIV